VLFSEKPSAQGLVDAHKREPSLSRERFTPELSDGVQHLQMLGNPKSKSGDFELRFIKNKTEILRRIYKDNR
jgi:hypothetical protein